MYIEYIGMGYGYRYRCPSGTGVWIITTVVPDVGSGCGRFGLWPFFGSPAPAKFLAGFARFAEC